MYYCMILFSTLLFSVEFIFTNGYRKENGSTWEASIKYSLYQGITGGILVLLLNKFQVEFTLFSFLVACVYACMNLMFSFVSVRSLEYANLSIYSMFSMLGGMLLPFVFGIAFCGESISIGKIACCILIFVSLYMVISGEDSPKGAVKYYFAVFVLNGMFGVLSKFHQMNVERCTDSESFTIMIRLVCVTICLAVMFLKKYSFRISLKSAFYCAGGASLNNVANLMLLIVLLHLPASVQYPLVTGGVIIFSTIADKLFGARLERRNVLAAGVAFAAICCMAL